MSAILFLFLASVPGKNIRRKARHQRDFGSTAGSSAPTKLQRSPPERVGFPRWLAPRIWRLSFAAEVTPPAEIGDAKFRSRLSAGRAHGAPSRRAALNRAAGGCPCQYAHVATLEDMVTNRIAERIAIDSYRDHHHLANGHPHHPTHYETLAQKQEHVTIWPRIPARLPSKTPARELAPAAPASFRLIYPI